MTAYGWTVKNLISWAKIDAECEGYKVGFVRVFERYRDQETDKKGANGRPIKVTATSFAEHFGIPKSTFARWVRRTAASRPEPTYESDRHSRVRAVRSAARTDPEAVIEAIMELPEQRRDEIFHEVKLRRAGEDRTPANRKAAEAWAAEQVAPITRMTDELRLTGMGAVLVEMAEDIDRIVTGDVDYGKQLRETRKGYDRLGKSLEMAEAIMGVKR